MGPEDKPTGEWTEADVDEFMINLYLGVASPYQQRVAFVKIAESAAVMARVATLAPAMLCLLRDEAQKIVKDMPAYIKSRGN